MQCAIGCVRSFPSIEAVNETYRSSPWLEVRRGIIDGLYDPTRDYSDDFDIEWKMEFALHTARENLEESKLRLKRSKDTTLPKWEKSILVRESVQFAGMTKCCLMYLMRWYLSLCEIHTPYVRDSIRKVTIETAHEVIKVLSCPGTAGLLSLTEKETAEVNTFLRAYGEENKTGKNAEKCLDAIINQERPELFAGYTREQVYGRCLAQFILWSADHPGKSLSQVLELSHESGGHGKALAEYLLLSMARNGSLDKMATFRLEPQAQT